MGRATPLDVTANERGQVRVFSLDPELAREIAGDDSLAPLAQALGVPALDPADVQIVEMRVMEQVGLTGLLVEGYDVDPVALDDDADRLDQLSGEVALIRSGAFGGTATQLRLTGRATLMGLYPERSAAPPRFDPLESDAALGRGGLPSSASAEANPRPLSFWLAIALAALCIALLIWSLL